MGLTRLVGFSLVLASLAVTSSPVYAVGPEPSEPIELSEPSDVSNVIGHDSHALGLETDDPLGLLLRVETLREHSLGDDKIDVWVCDIDETPDEVMAIFSEQVEPWFEANSRGRYTPVFVSKGEGCIAEAVQNPSPGANAAVIVDNSAGGFSQILSCQNGPCAGYETFPSNSRYAFVGIYNLGTNAVHEMGHLLRWMHSYSGQSFSQYDNAADVLSGNYGIGNLGGAGTYALPYGTAAINRYAAGWIDTDEVALIDTDVTLNLFTHSGLGRQMAVIQDGDSYFTLDARVSSDLDPIPDAWSGVAIYRVSGQPFPDGVPGFRRVAQEPPVPFNAADFAAYEEPLESILRLGQSTTLGGTEVMVIGTADNGFRVQFGEGHDGTFIDDDSSTFQSDIEWLAASGITKSCNPPFNDMFCPNSPVTRGQMAAFLHRALPDLPVVRPVIDFTDDGDSIFEADIEWLYSVGVTQGNSATTFNPNGIATRGQMAAFLVRALKYEDDGGGDLFIDDDTSPFSGDIDRLGTAGVTRGCNPPTNDRFCPDGLVTRGQMAAFLHRALGG